MDIPRAIQRFVLPQVCVVFSLPLYLHTLPVDNITANQSNSQSLEMAYIVQEISAEVWVFFYFSFSLDAWGSGWALPNRADREDGLSI